MSLKEIKEQALEYKDWVQFATKLNDPFLSIFSSVINEGIKDIQYQVGKDYYFDDGEFNFKISVVNDNDAPRFNFYIKPKILNVIIDPKKVKDDEKKYLGMKPGILLSIIVFGILLIILVVTAAPLMKAFFGV